MTRLDHLLWNLAEECAEVAQRASKAARFSMEEKQEGQEFTNAERIVHEIADLCAVLEIMEDEGYLSLAQDYEDRIEAKKKRFDDYLVRSKEHGRLDGAS